MTLSVALPSFAQPDAPVTTKPKANKTTVRTVGTAYLRVLHAMPGGPKVDVYAGTTKVGSNLAYKSISDYVELKSGKNIFKIVGAGKTEALITDSKSLAKTKYFTLAIMGKQAPALLVVNDSTGKEMPDKARVRVVHLSPGAPAVLITAPSTRAKIGYTKFIAKPLEYGKSASKTVKPMTAKLQVRTEDGKIVKETGDLELVAGKRYDAFAIGEVGATGANAFEVLVKPAAK